MWTLRFWIKVEKFVAQQTLDFTRMDFERDGCFDHFENARLIIDLQAASLLRGLNKFVHFFGTLV
jgi:hypothetical protein